MAPASKRRFVSSSSSGDYDPVTSVCSIEDYVAGKDLYRAAPIGLIPTPWPFGNGICTQRGANVAKVVEPEYMKIIESFNIKYSTIGLHTRWSKSHRSEAVDTLFVGTWAYDVDYTKWKEAASQILELFYAAGLQPGEINVEIYNPKEMYRDNSTCLPDDQELLGAIREVEPRVLEVVRKELPGIWTSIAYHMRGPDDDASKRKPTVMITCKPGARHSFERVESSIAAVLASEKFPRISLHLELIPALIELAAPPSPDRDLKPRPLLMLKDLPTNGASIGVHGKQMGAGTLGGWVHLKSIDNPNLTMECALTCFHVISEGDPANRAHIERNGIGLDKTEPLTQIRIVSPSHFDATETKRYMQSQIQSYSKERDRKYLELVNNLSAADPIGYVRFASGYRRTTDNRRLDWALIDSPSTFTCNKPPPSAAFDQDWFFEKLATYRTDESDFIKGFGTLKEGDWVARVGRSTTAAGEVNRINRRVNWEGNIPESYEAEVIGLGRDFAIGGDSGSMVVNDRFELVGLLIGIERGSGQQGSGFVTPIQAIRDDLKAVIGADISLP